MADTRHGGARQPEQLSGEEREQLASAVRRLGIRRVRIELALGGDAIASAMAGRASRGTVAILRLPSGLGRLTREIASHDRGAA
jgi:hypothetical protein